MGTFPLPRSTVLTTFAPEGTYYARLAAHNACGATPFGSEISFTVLPPSDASLIGTWNGTVSNYTKPYPWTPITSFQLTLNANPSGPEGRCRECGATTKAAATAAYSALPARCPLYRWKAWNATTATSS